MNTPLFDDSIEEQYPSWSRHQRLLTEQIINRVSPTTLERNSDIVSDINEFLHVFKWIRLKM